MPKERATLEGLPGLKVALAKKAEELHAAAAVVVAQEVDEIHDDAVRQAPRDKGDLQRGIRTEVVGAEGTVKSTSRHAGFVEHGTYKDKAQPYMQPAAEKSRRRLPKRAVDIIRAALGG